MRAIDGAFRFRGGELIDSGEGLEDPVLRRFDAMWRAARGKADRLPSRGRMNPCELRALLGHLMAIDVLAQGDRQIFRGRLVGDQHVRACGGSMAGRLLAGPSADPAADVACLRAVVELREPMLWSGRWPADRGPAIDFVCALYPLSEDGERIDRIAAVLVQNEVQPPAAMAA